MPRHISKKQQVKQILSDIEAGITGDNVDLAISILKWTKQKIELGTSEDKRSKRYNESRRQKSKPRHVKRGNIYYALLGRNIGSEQNGYRPVLVIQDTKASAISPTVLVIPLTSAHDRSGKLKKVYSSQLAITHPKLTKPSLVKTEYMRNISKNRLRDLICSLDDPTMSLIEEKIKYSLQLT